MRLAPILTSLLFLVCYTFAQDGEHIIRAGSGGISGDYCDVKAYNDDIAYYTNRYGLIVMDVSDPEDPHPARIIPTRGNAQGLFLKDSLLFLCDGYEGLRIYDVSDDPWNPREISHTTGPTNARGLVVIDDFAYLWQYRNSVGFIYDVSDPEHPEELSRTNFRGGESMQIHPFGDRCYIVSANAPTSYWDISDRTNPEMIGVVNGTLRGSEHNTLFDDRLAYVISGRTVHHIVDSLQTDSVYFLDDWAASSNKLINDMLYCTGSAKIRNYRYPGISIGNFSNYRQPRLVSSIWGEFRGGTRAISRFFDLLDGRMFTCDGEKGTTIYDVSDVEHPATLGYYDNRGDFHNVALSPDYIYTSNRLNWQVHRQNSFRLRVYSRHPAANPREVFALELGLEDSVIRGGSNWFERPVVIGDRLYGLANNFFTGFTLEDPARPAPLFIVNQNQFGVGEDFVVDGTIAYTVSTYIYAIDFSDYRNPRLLSRVYCYQAQGGIACDERYLYVHSWSDGLYIYSRANNRLSEVGLLRLGPTVEANDILLYANRAYIILSHYALIVDISDPTNPVVVGELRWPGLTWRASISDGVLFASCSELGVHAYSLEDPDNPRRVGYYDTPGRSHQALMQDGYLYVADSDEIGVYDVGEITGWWDLELSADGHDFGGVSIDTSAVWELAITNNAQHPITIFSATTTDSIFSVVFNDSVELQPGGSLSVLVTFRPRENGNFADTLVLTTDRRIVRVALSGRGVPLSAENDVRIPLVFALYPVHPNPFNQLVQICYTLPAESDIRLTIYDLNGRLVEQLASERKDAGRYTLSWTAKGIASGLYILRLESGKEVRNQKLMLIR